MYYFAPLCFQFTEALGNDSSAHTAANSMKLQLCDREKQLKWKVKARGDHDIFYVK